MQVHRCTVASSLRPTLNSYSAQTEYGRRCCAPCVTASNLLTVGANFTQVLPAPTPLEGYNAMLQKLNVWLFMHGNRALVWPGHCVAPDSVPCTGLSFGPIIPWRRQPTMESAACLCHRRVFSYKVAATLTPILLESLSTTRITPRCCTSVVLAAAVPVLQLVCLSLKCSVYYTSTDR